MGGLAARAKSISMRTSDRGDIQEKLPETLRGEWCAEHDRGENELIKSLLELSRAGLFLSKWLPLGTSGICIAGGKVLTFTGKWVWLALYMVGACSGR